MKTATKHRSARVTACRAAWLLFALAAPLAFPVAAQPPTSEPVRVLTGDACVPWGKIECHEDIGITFPQEPFLPETEHHVSSKHGKGIVEAFDNNPRPHSKYFLLHEAAGWEKATHPVPVLFVHGAATNATLSFAGTYFDGSQGLMQYLSERGYAVFALTMPCGQGDLFYMTEHLARAIDLVRARTKASQVDLVAHSMGGIVARMYVTGMRLRGGASYRGDVRRVVFVGTPHRGIDLTFRHPIAYQRFGSYGVPAPWTFYKPEGEITERSIYGPAFRAQLQLLFDLTDVHRLSEMEMDWYTTFNGGTGFVSKSKGIREAIKMGGNHMEKLRARRFPASVEVSVLAGRKNLVKYVTKSAQILEEVGEFDGPCDGLLFVKSGADEEGLRAAGARLTAREVLDLNHVELLYLEPGKAWIEARLGAEAGTGSGVKGAKGAGAVGGGGAGKKAGGGGKGS
ncbi:MAG: alpha/beta fold hydrolase [Planctomycetes bacterium]|nr:alpha/beta fold hydrolase [Planctomycetota bacterium]